MYASPNLRWLKNRNQGQESASCSVSTPSMASPIVPEEGAFGGAHSAILAACSDLVISSDTNYKSIRENIQWSKLLRPASFFTVVLDKSGVDDESCQRFVVGGTLSLPLISTLIGEVTLT